MRNRLKIALSEFDRRTEKNPDAMFGLVSLFIILPFLFLFLSGSVLGRYVSPTFLLAYFQTFILLIGVPTIFIGPFFLKRIFRISKEIAKEGKSKGKVKMTDNIKTNASEEV